MNENDQQEIKIKAKYMKLRRNRDRRTFNLILARFYPLKSMGITTNDDLNGKGKDNININLLTSK